ncbi:MAG TPA: zinc-dependent metalloprotease family protein [Pyrinomonadaceae bacterium]|jgi:hypothetical protein
MRRSEFRRAHAFALFLCLAAAAAMLVLPAASGQGTNRAAEEIGRALGRFDRLSLEPAELLRGARESGRVSLKTSRGTFDLDVEPFDIRSDAYRAVAVGPDGALTELPRTPSRWWRGTVAGEPDTRVRLALDGEKFSGIIVTPAETFFVEPARGLSAAAGAREFVFYAGSDVKEQGGECGTTMAERVGAQSRTDGLAAGKSGDPAAEAVFGPRRDTEMATEADFEYYVANGSNETVTTSDMNDIMASVDAIYDAQLGIRIRVVFQRVWTVSTDPYTQSEASAAVNELAQVYNGSFAQFNQTPPQRDLVHMFTGKDFLGSTIGIAFTGVTCNEPPFAYGISQSKFSQTKALRVAVTAHEIGHNFGASHTNQEVGGTPAGCSPSIMNSSVQNTDQFCQFSRDQITNHVAEFGSCLSLIKPEACTYSLGSDPSPFFPAEGGAGSVTVVTPSSCPWSLSEGADWITTQEAALSGTAAAAFTVAPNTNSGPRQASIDAAGNKVTVRQAAAPSCFGAQIVPGQTVQGALSPTDCRSGQPGRANAPLDLYVFTARAGQRVRVEMLAAVRASDTPSGTPPPEALDCYLYLFGPDGSVVDFNDDRSLNPHDTDSSVPVAGFVTLPATGIYTVAATSFSNNDDGAYTLRLLDDSSANTVALASAAYAVNEEPGAGGLGTDGSGFRVVTVTRAGDTAGTASVDYATSDGTASGRTDYTRALGTLVFGPNETSKSFTVFVTDDAFQESPETVQITLSNPTGTTLGATPSATLTINSADAVTGPSPVRAESFDVAFFVRQHYLDFFSREPDPSGFAFWQNEITSCGANAVCAEVRRINVSAAFFLSIEFQETGYLVYRFYKAAYGDATSPNVPGTVPVIRFDEFLPDTQRIGRGVAVGVDDWQTQLEANKQAYALEFVLRPRFLAAYPVSMTPAAFVDKLIQNSGVTLTPAERAALIAQLNASPNAAAARAAVLRQVAENAQLRSAEKNRAFVLMQYFGYLRRNPDDAPNTDFTGWRFWLDKLEQFHGNFVQAEMVKAFLNSTEYIDRFGSRQ